MKFMHKVFYLTLIIGSIVCATKVAEDSKASLTPDTKTQLKRATEDTRQQNHNINSGQSSVTNLPQFYGGHFAQLGNFFASAAAPQIYYVKAPQSNHAGVQYAPANALKIAYAPAQQPQHSATKISCYCTSATLSSIPADIHTVPYNHQQQIIPIAHANGYQLAAIPHQQVHISQPYSFVAAAQSEASKVVPSSNAAHSNNAYQPQQTFTFPTYQHVAAPINIPTTQKFVAFPSYSNTQYKAINGPAQPSTTTATHTGDGATSFATFSQQLNHRHHTTPTAVTPVKVLAQPQQFYVTAPPPSPAAYSSHKIPFQPIPAASSSPQAYESPHNVNGVIHYGTHLYHHHHHHHHLYHIVYRRRFNFELEKDFADVNVVATVKVNRLRWAGHLFRMNDERAPLKLFNSEPAGRRGVGRPKNRWIDNVTADLKSLGVQNWRSSAQDRQCWNRILDQAKSKRWT